MVKYALISRKCSKLEADTFRLELFSTTIAYPEASNYPCRYFFKILEKS